LDAGASANNGGGNQLSEQEKRDGEGEGPRPAQIVGKLEEEKDEGNSKDVLGSNNGLAL